MYARDGSGLLDEREREELDRLMRVGVYVAEGGAFVSWQAGVTLVWLYRWMLLGEAQREDGSWLLDIDYWRIGQRERLEPGEVALALDELDEYGIIEIVVASEYSCTVRLIIAGFAVREKRPAAKQIEAVEVVSPRMPSRRMAKLIERFKAACHYCGRAGTTARDPDDRYWTRDHIRPLIEGGTSDPENLVLACVRCNATKRDRPVGYLLGRLGQTAPAGAMAAAQHRTAVEEAEDLIAALFE